MIEKIRSYLQKNETTALVIYVSVFSFLTYTCMYAFRRPWSVGFFEIQPDMLILGMSVSYKSMLLISQVFGYAAFKFVGIKFISELKKKERFRNLMFIVFFSMFCLLGFAIVLPTWKLLFLGLSVA